MPQETRPWTGYLSRNQAKQKPLGRNELQVFVLTSGRVRHQNTLKSLACTSLWYTSVNLHIVIPKNEKAAWDKVNPQWVTYLHCVEEHWTIPR